MVSKFMNSKNRRTLEAIFANPVRADVKWSDIEALVLACGGEVEEGRGSRVLVKLNGERAVFHRPHPKPDTDKGALKAVRRFLESVGIKP
jgi:hypothetical protein